MILNNRSIEKLLSSIYEKRYQKNVINILTKCSPSLKFLFKYVVHTNKYPYTFNIKTPLKTLKITAYHYHDLLTINEIFFREDYLSSTNIKCIVDLGGNIGISCMYFLSRNSNCKVYTYEPYGENRNKLSKHLLINNLNERVEINKEAVSSTTKKASFGIEPTGRYCGLYLNSNKTITIDCLSINTVLEKIFSKHNTIDILKIDIEDAEFETIQAISNDFLPRIKLIYSESIKIDKSKDFMFDISQVGTITTYKNKLFD
ncbi:FkbM family methyltransferase [Patescibacteria group bacterium]|nr:FkbM family methyltransferase [Patescibacteria group bacterium]